MIARVSHALAVFVLITSSAETGAVPSAANWSFAVVHAFARGTDGDSPQTGLLLASDGTFYGTTANGGQYGNGTIFNVASDGTERVVHHFSDTEGRFPSELLEGNDGNLYGTMRSGFTSFGFIFRLAPDGAFAVLYSFRCGDDGATPTGPLLQGDDGDLYGMTFGFSSDQCSARPAIFRLSLDGRLSVIHVFTGPDGADPHGALIQATDGNLYGTTSAGGPFGGGTVFRLTRDGRLTVLHGFHYPDNGEGYAPQAALVEAADGIFYGTASQGGNCLFCGTIFRVTADGQWQIVYAFPNRSDVGQAPRAPLIQDGDGNLYGTTWLTKGSLFRITPAGQLTLLHAFGGDWDGANVQAPLVRGPEGAFYGVAASEGPSLTGTVFRVTADGSVFDVLYGFPGGQEGTNPSALSQAVDGTIYGVASQGGAFNRGTVFRLETDGAATPTHTFTGGVDGAGPSAIIQAWDGNFYGLTASGGDAGGGTIFQLAPDGGLTTLYSFSPDQSPVSAPPSAGLVQATDGNIYGVSTGDGDYGRGALFRLSSDGILTVLHSFSGGPEGSQPIGLIQANDGTLYGITYHGGRYNAGTIFRLTTDGTFMTLRDDFQVHLGSHALVQGANGALYLITYRMTTTGDEIDRLTVDGDLNLLHAFTSLDGNAPQGAIQGIDGNLYGTALINGTFGGGTVFQMALDGSVAVLHAFSSSGDPDGRAPLAPPIQAADGTTYGTTSAGGGVASLGVVYCLARK